MTESEAKTEQKPAAEEKAEENVAKAADDTSKETKDSGKDGDSGKKGDTKDAKADKDKKEKEAEQAPPVPEMKAVVLTGFGGLKSVKILQKPQPTAGEGEILIRVKASGLNFLDLMARQGAIDNLPKAPFIMGFECAGDVEAVGEGVTGFEVGKRVVAFSDMKAWAELVTVPAKHAYILPEAVSYNDAAAILMNYTVAHALLFDVANLREGQTVLIHSIGGGVGQALAQLSKTVKDVTVIGTASKAKHEQLADIATHLLEREQCYVQQVKKIAENGVDLVLDCSCGEDVNKGYSLLKPMGRYVLYGTSCFVSGETKNLFSFAKSWWQVDKINPIKLYDDNKTISGFNLRHLLFQQNQHEYVAGKVATVFELFATKKITPVIDSSWAFEDIAEAMQKMHDRKNVGKLLLDPSKEPKPKPAEPEKVAKVGRKESKKEKRNKDKKEEKKDEKKEEAKDDDKKEDAKKEEAKENGDSEAKKDDKKEDKKDDKKEDEKK